MLNALPEKKIELKEYARRQKLKFKADSPRSLSPAGPGKPLQHPGAVGNLGRPSPVLRLRAAPSRGQPLGLPFRCRYFPPFPSCHILPHFYRVALTISLVDGSVCRAWPAGRQAPSAVTSATCRSSSLPGRLKPARPYHFYFNPAELDSLVVNLQVTQQPVPARGGAGAAGQSSFQARRRRRRPHLRYQRRRGANARCRKYFFRGADTGKSGPPSWFRPQPGRGRQALSLLGTSEFKLYEIGPRQASPRNGQATLAGHVRDAQRASRWWGPRCTSRRRQWAWRPTSLAIRPHAARGPAYAPRAGPGRQVHQAADCAARRRQAEHRGTNRRDHAQGSGGAGRQGQERDQPAHGRGKARHQGPSSRCPPPLAKPTSCGWC